MSYAGLTCHRVTIRDVLDGVVMVGEGGGVVVGLVVEGGETAVARTAEGRAGVPLSDQLTVVVLIVKDQLAEREEIFRGPTALR